MDEQQDPSGEPTATPPEPIDPVRMEMYMQSLREKQDLARGITGGLAAAIGGAVLWAIITYVSHIQVGWMAVGIGFLVGYAVRKMGEGVDPVFGYSAAALSLFGCALGNFLAIAVQISVQEEAGLMEVLGFFFARPGMVLEAMKETFHPMDLLFYGIAVYWGYTTAFRRVSPEELRGMPT